MANLIKTCIEIPLPSEKIATVIYNVLIVDDEPPRSQVTKTLTRDNNVLKIEFEARLAKQVRVACTSFFESLHLIVETINFTGLPKHSGYSYP